MTSVPSVSQLELTQRRRILRRHRRMKLLQSLWQTLAISGILASLVWATNQPIWVVRESNQIIIEGNKLLTTQKIRSLLVLDYPQSLLKIEPEAIAQALELQPTIAQATVTRQLFPPSLIVQVKERVPVAIAVITQPQSKSTVHSKPLVGFLDTTGVWIPVNSYHSSQHPLKLPALKVIGIPEQYRSYWHKMYQLVTNSSIKVTEINCQDLNNLIFKTDLGMVHLGSYSSQLAEQLKVLAQMQHLPSKVAPSQIAYIDLKDPKNPLVQMNSTKKLVKPDTQ